MLARPLRGSFAVHEARGVLEGFGAHTTLLLGEPSGDGRTYRLDAVVAIDVRASENSRRTLPESIKAAAKQLANGPPGLVAVHYVDPASDLDALLPSQLPFATAVADTLIKHPQLAGALVSSEPMYALPGDVQPGPAWTFLADDRIPADFPLRDAATVLDVPRITAAV